MFEAVFPNVLEKKKGGGRGKKAFIVPLVWSIAITVENRKSKMLKMLLARNRVIDLFTEWEGRVLGCAVTVVNTRADLLEVRAEDRSS